MRGVSQELPGPATVWVVRNSRAGPYEFSRDMREQDQWREHAAFMNGLVDDGVVLIGGPLEGGVDTLLLCVAPSEDALRRRLAQDPWMRNGMLAHKSIELLTVALSPAWVDVILQERAPMEIDRDASQTRRLPPGPVSP